MKQRTKIGKVLDFKDNNELIDNDINELINWINSIYANENEDLKIKINYYPSKGINNLVINPKHFADLVFSIGKLFYVIKFINSPFSIDITSSNWKEKNTNNKINPTTSKIENWHDITEQVKFNLLKSEFRNYVGYNCVILNKQPLGKNKNKLTFIGSLKIFKIWIWTKITSHINYYIFDL